MVDQIIDKKTVAIPGPIGKPGPQGPMNPDTVPTDQAIADWLGTSTTLTFQALTKFHRTNSKYRGAKIVFIGDSISQGFGASDQSKRFTTLVAKALGAVEINVAFHGAGWNFRSPSEGGTSIPEQIDTVVNQYQDDNSIGAIVVCGGINDANSDPDTIRANVSTGLAKLQTAFPWAKIVVGNTPTAGIVNNAAGTPNIVGVAGMSNVIAAVNMGARDCALTTLPMWRYLMFTTNPSIFGDHLHPGDDGHAIYASIISTVLQDGFYPPTDTYDNKRIVYGNDARQLQPMLPGVGVLVGSVMMCLITGTDTVLLQGNLGVKLDDETLSAMFAKNTKVLKMPESLHGSNTAGNDMGDVIFPSIIIPTVTRVVTPVIPIEGLTGLSDYEIHRCNAKSGIFTFTLFRSSDGYIRTDLTTFTPTSRANNAAYPGMNTASESITDYETFKKLYKPIEQNFLYVNINATIPILSIQTPA
jgi:lysophospholipase L1-like esterase